MLFTSFSAAGGPKKEGAMGKSEEINAVLSCWGYGYKVKMLVNGTDVGVKGGMSESKRLFDKNNEMAAQATPDIRKKNFILVNGPNTISIEYSKNGANPADRVEITLEVENYPDLLCLTFSIDKAVGKGGEDDHDPGQDACGF